MQVTPRVVDLSHYQDVQDKFAGAVAMGLWGVINKVTEGVGYVDASFGWRKQPTKDKGLLYGAYHFMRPGDPVRQADWFLQQVGDPTGLLLACDHEDANVSVANARAFMEAVKAKIGRLPVYYSYQSFILERVRAMDASFWHQAKLWLASYSHSPMWPTSIWPKPWLWQYTGDGSGQGPHGVPGIVERGTNRPNKLDLNSYEGAQDQLKQEWAT